MDEDHIWAQNPSWWSREKKAYSFTGSLTLSDPELDNIHSFFEVAPSIEECADSRVEENSPARKRRKLSPKLKDLELERAWENPVPLCSLTFDLTTSVDGDTYSKLNKNAFHEKPRDVKLYAQMQLRRIASLDGVEPLHEFTVYTPNSYRLFIAHAGDNVEPRALRLLRSAIEVQRAYNRTKYVRVVSTLTQSSTFDEATSQWTLKYKLNSIIQWRNARTILEYSLDSVSDRLLSVLFDNHVTNGEPVHTKRVNFSPRDFYDCVHVPISSGQEADEASKLQVTGLQATLYPFQKRTISWMLNQERVDHNHGIKEKSHSQQFHGFFPVIGLDKQIFFVNKWLGLVTTDQDILVCHQSRVSGGLLAEEMGLGKTVEVISLILKHQRQMSPLQGVDSRQTGLPATLIVSPLAIQQQWLEEIEIHAPQLKVMVYNGMKSMEQLSEKEMVEKLYCYDIVLCSYNVLSAEIHYAEPGPDRVLRHEKQYVKRKSPLVLTEWWRVILDEAQMVESGVSQAARVVNQIWRQNSWAVTGTPIRKDFTDLLGLLIFLRISPYGNSEKLFRRLLLPENQYIFKELWSTISVRHTKDQISSELELPRQNRYVINMPLTQVEEQHYANIYQEMCNECGLSLEGAPLTDDWDPNDPSRIEKMRTFLARLRQTILHPEVGSVNRRALGQSEGPLRTVAEVLEVMIEQNETAMRTEQRAFFVSRIKRGQLLLEHGKKPAEALEIWLDVKKAANEAVEECKKAFEQAKAGDAEAVKVKDEVDEDSTEEESDEHKVKNRMGRLRTRLRGAMEVLHTAIFFVATAYFQIRSDEDSVIPDSEQHAELEDKETGTYDEAKALRKEILAEPRTRANGFMNKVKKRKFTEMPKFEELIHGGIESRKLLDKADLLAETMEEHGDKLVEWRKKMLELLMLPLMDQEEVELTGEEYELSTQQQDEQYAYHEALRWAAADRSDWLTGQVNGLIKRDTSVAMTMARSGNPPAPELMLELLTQRQALAPHPTKGYLRGIIQELRGLRTDLERHSSTRVQGEIGIIERAIESLQRDLAAQTKAVTGLEKEVDLCREGMNARLEYYRALQAISDAVQPIDPDAEFEPKGLMVQIAKMQRDEDKQGSKLKSLKSHGRYLQSLKQEDASDEGIRRCVICQDEIVYGVFISCGHQFCRDCIREWYQSHRTCPMCKKKLTRSDFTPISYKPKELTAEEETTNGSAIKSKDEQVADGADRSLYSPIHPKVLAEIRNVDLPGSFGTKIDTLARHIIALRTMDPGAKSIIFSQFKDFLDILGKAFKRFGVGFTTIDDKKQGVEKFKRDSSIECFLLHAKAHSSGLTLVNATHVFLAEPLVNTALELQAIARVHRIGQHSQTNVYKYLVPDTVEKAIYDLALRRRLEYISKAQHNSPAKNKSLAEDDIEKANSIELEESTAAKMLTKGKGGGELVAQNDLWFCLFGVKTARLNKTSDDAARAVAGFLGAEAADQRGLAERPGSR